MTGNQRGRPRVEREETAARHVKAMAAMGVPLEGVAAVIGIARHTLTKLYAHELELGGIEANAKVAESLFQMATGTAGKKANVVACPFWLKARAGWREDDDGMGKKEAAALLARVADKDTGWSGLLATGEPES
ncbi:hypothetical protein [Variovorax sp. J22R115]|uniref:hypothetical protein n=1 Tax=Variovorax sp. J22R115 TaxID=3053509 RepID=UPI002577E543|nr:hypothetical protein [Variovorax sp. J22R115]MDM0052016.1 hypothetical protein [Variovorax sp. J22R115]